jgi:hypothetical protein
MQVDWMTDVARTLFASKANNSRARARGALTCSARSLKSELYML